MLNHLDAVVDVCMYVSGENKESERSNKLIIVLVACRLNHSLDTNIDENSDQLHGGPDYGDRLSFLQLHGWTHFQSAGISNVPPCHLF